MPPGKPLENRKARDVGSAQVCFKTDDIHGLYGRLLDNEYQVHSKPQQGPSQLVMYFRDPDGIILKAIEGKTKV